MKDAFAPKRDEYFLNGVIEHHEHRHDPSSVSPAIYQQLFIKQCPLART